MGRLFLLLVVLAGTATAEAPPPPRPAASEVDAEAAGPGPVCGDPRLAGTALAPVSGEGGCGIAAPVRLATVAGVALDPPPTLDCAVGVALAGWLGTVAVPAFDATGARLEALVLADGYSCRNRNRAATGKLSEHALGRAIDVGGFRLGDGTTVAVRDGWGSAEWGATLRRLHDGACGPFGTVLGPEANPLHADHLHFDVAERRSGPWCE